MKAWRLITPLQLILLVAMVAFSLFISGCSTLLGFTPERAVVGEILQSGDSNSSVLPDSIQVRQSVRLDGDVLVMVTYQKTGRNNQIEDCLDVYSVEQTSTGWRPGGGGSTCMTAGAVNQAVEISGGSQSASNEPALSYTYGLVHDPDITNIDVTWADGQAQTVEVVNSSYLAVRSDFVDYQQVRGLGAGGEALFTSAPIEVPPGKQKP